MVFITFIIPTIGRPSLKQSLESLLNQTIYDWNAIVIFDGIKNNNDFEINDNRIKYIEIDKIGNVGYSGYVRNIGFKEIDYYNTEWIGFLDDDDTLGPSYIEKLKEEISIKPTIEVCIFRMSDSKGNIIPNKLIKNIIKCNIGISFAIKSQLTKNYLFQNNKYEDYIYLKNLEYKKHKIVISSYVNYFVRCKPYMTEFYPKIYIN